MPRPSHLNPARLLLVLVGAFAALVLIPPPAFACSCVGGTDADFYKRADAVVAGIVTDKEMPSKGPVMSSGDAVTYSVDVAGVYKGAPVATVQFTSAGSGASCGLEGVEAGREYVVFLAGQSGSYTANLCGGTRPADLTALPSIAGHTFVTAAPVETAAPVASDDVEEEADEVALSDWAVPIALAGGGVLALMAGVLWVRYLRG